jgi:hypothetical protein
LSFVSFSRLADEQKKNYLESLFDKTEENRLSGQDSVKGKVDAELARARDLRDVSSTISEFDQ